MRKGEINLILNSRDRSCFPLVYLIGQLIIPITNPWLVTHLLKPLMKVIRTVLSCLSSTPVNGSQCIAAFRSSASYTKTDKPVILYGFGRANVFRSFGAQSLYIGA